MFHAFADPQTRRSVRDLVPDAVHRPLPADHATDLVGLHRRLRDGLRTFQPQVVHAHLFHASILVALQRLSAARVLTQHHGAALVLTKGKMARRVDRIVTRRYDAVVAVSSEVARYLNQSYSVAPHRIVTILNGWDGSPQRRVRRSRPTLVSVGNLRPEKGHGVLIEAMAAVKEVHPDVRLLLVGDGPERGRLEVMTRMAQAEENVEFLGEIDDVWPVLALADVFVMPSRAEQLGIAALEGMAAGLPVVASAVGGLPEVVVHGETGLLVPPGDARALAAALLELLGDPATADRFGRAAEERAKAMRAEDMATRYLQLYDRLTRPPDR